MMNLSINILIYPNEQEVFIEEDCFGATDQEMEKYKQVAFAIETVCQPIIGIVGLIANLVALPILCK